MEKKVIDLEIIENVENSGVYAISLVDVPAIEKTWMAFKAEVFVNPSKGERQDEFIPRCIAKLVGDEGYETDQAAAICYSTWRETHKAEEFADTYTDYPEAAVDNAKRALAWAEENGWGDCGMGAGKARANQLANREPISRETIARMSAFQRHRQNSDTPYGEGCGKLMWDAWGGDEGIAWAERKLDQIDREEMSIDVSALPPYVDELPKKKMEMSEEFDNIEDAIERSLELGLKGEIHSHATEDGFIYMPGASHDDLEDALEREEFAPASGKPGDRPLARIPKEERGRTGSAKNKPGDTKNTRGGIEVPAEVEKTLKEKIKEHNEKYTEESKKADLGMLKAVWRRGAGAYSVGTPGKRGMVRTQWATARVNAFLNILAGKRSGYDKDYKQDNDLLPKGHPKHSEEKMSKMFFASEDQRIVIGPAMIPDIVIPRIDKETKERYEVRFSKETIAKIAEKFMRELRNNQTNVQHDGANGAGSYVKESWIVETEDDKANTKYGLDVPVGTWMVAMRVQDPAVWKMVKEGQLNGFSIEGDFMSKEDYEQYQKDREMYNRVIKILKSF